jgi:predicted AlkP superfamily pyrophosphatase or phosphodiesterase
MTVGAREVRTARPVGKGSHVLIVVVDGLRRDAVTAEGMPTLWALKQSGVFFAAHHPAYLSTTEVNGTALATGMYPGRSGVMANKEYRPAVELLRPVDTQGQWAQWKGDQKGPWIGAATLPELARAHGLRTAVAGTKGVAIMWDRSFANRTVESATVFEGKAIPSAVLDRIHPEFGPLPPGVDWKHFHNVEQDTWTQRVLTEKLWGESAEGVPAVSVLWLSEPDFSQHGTGPGSAQAKAALRSSDNRLAAALAALERRGLRDKTNVVVTSDHGFSTIDRKVDVPAVLKKAGFKATENFKAAPENGSVMIVGLGGSVSLYVTGPREDAAVEAVREKLVKFLQGTDWAGVIFTREGRPGTFRLSEVGIDSATAPDVVVALKWKDEQKKDRMPGVAVATGMDVGQGMHGTLSRYDMGNTLVAAGPDFKAGVENRLPSASHDVAPTLAYLLGLTSLPDQAMDGRVLFEALSVEGAGREEAGAPKTEVLTAQEKWKTDKGEKVWSQYLKVTTYAGRRYYDEGNVGAPPAK